MSKTLKEQLGNVFVNGCGEVCAKSEAAKNKLSVKDSKKKVADKDRGRRESISKSKKELQELRSKERKMEQKIKDLRSDGLKNGPGTEQCVQLFAEANEINNELRGVRKSIRKLNKRFYK